jgi:adenylate cyclase
MEFTSRIRFFIILYSIVFALVAFFIFADSFHLPAESFTKTFISQAGFSKLKIGELNLYYKILVACIISLLPSLYFVNIGNKRATTLVLATGALILIAAYILLSNNNIIIPILYFELALAIGAGAAIILKMVITSSQSSFLKLAFSQFVSESMLKELMKNPDKLKLQGAEIDITILFMDIRGFTTFSENNTPILVVHMLNDLLDKVTNIILDHGGTVDKYMGDAVMAFWGAPGTDKKQATNALDAAIAIQNKIQSETQFNVGVGLNYGHAIVGNMGSTRRFDYTAVGDTVNTAKRLESATKELGEPIVLSEAVHNKLIEEKAKIKTKDIGHISLKGKSQRVHIFGIETQ